jgi:hypothetical protein
MSCVRILAKEELVVQNVLMPILLSEVRMGECLEDTVIPGRVLFSIKFKYDLFVLFHSKFATGSIAVKAPSSLRAYFKLSGKEVVVDEEAHVQEMAKDCKGDGVTVTGKETAYCCG